MRKYINRSRIIIITTILTLCIYKVSKAQSLHFDGLYRAHIQDINYGTDEKPKFGKVYSYLRFYKDKVVIDASTAGSPKQVADWLIKSGDFSKGTYKIQGSKISFSTTWENVIVDYTGTIENNGLTLNLHFYSHSNGYQKTEKFSFIKVSLK